MRIVSLAFEDKVRQWKLEPMTFGRLTLLVGASGVGKTQILNAIQSLVRVAGGQSLNGVEWSITFQTTPNDTYTWEGEFEKQQYLFSEGQEEGNRSKIIYEKLDHNDNVFVERNENQVLFNKQEIVKLASERSIIETLKEESLVAEIYRQFHLITFSDYTNPERSARLRKFDLNGGISSLDSIRNSSEDSRTRLYLASLHAPKIFNIIKESFIDIFPFVEDVKIAHAEFLPPNSWLSLVPLIQIKEQGVENWIHEFQISSGMYRSLLQISDLYLRADGTVFLIDEFENSLGINCLDDLTSALVSHERDLQFIITSHHPYIINNISYSNWKIVTRHGGVVTAHDADEFNLGKSKHQAFTQLINLDAYAEGVGA